MINKNLLRHIEIEKIILTLASVPLDELDYLFHQVH